MTVAHCTKNFWTKNVENVVKIHEYSRIFEKFQHFFALLDEYFQMNQSKIWYLNTVKTSKNPRNSAYLYRLSIAIYRKNTDWNLFFFDSFQILFLLSKGNLKTCSRNHSLISTAIYNFKIKSTIHRVNSLGWPLIDNERYG